MTQFSREYVFGSGYLFASPTDTSTDLGPIRFGTLQDVSVEFTGDVKELHGQYSFPVATGRGKMKIAIKAGNGDIDLDLYNSLFFGGAPAAVGSFSVAPNEAGTPAGTPPIVTVSNSAQFDTDFGVVVAATGEPLEQVPTSPTAGQYSVNSTTGIYTFPTGYVTPVLITYRYKVPSVGSTLTMTNQLIGAQPHFILDLMETFEGRWFMAHFNNVICHKLGQPVKMDDFSIADLEMSAQVDSANNLGWMSISAG